MNTNLVPTANRRRFLQQGSQALAAGWLGSVLAAEKTAGAPKSETLVQQLYGSLKEEQRAAICLPWNDSLRLKVDNNWHIRKERIRDVLNADQQDLVKQIFHHLHSPEYVDAVWKQFDEDNKRDGGFGSSSIALFGSPGEGKF
ncbi:MAG TPA: hypothetical protein VD994_12735, partial [Prosthecobacter sp.]|nr:hypothetical protein [Prosthecobacter sp.]